LWPLLVPLILAIHSPAKLCAVDGNEAVGRVYTLTLSGVMREGRPSYRNAATMDGSQLPSD
jgi:hypothetical protein